MKGASEPPAAPDPAKTAAAQSASNAQTAMLQAEINRVNQYTPYGNIVYSQVPGASPAPAPQTLAPTGGGRRGEDGRGGDGDGGGGTPDYTYTPGQNTWRADVTLSPEQQRLYDLKTAGQTQYGEIANESLGRVRDIMGTDLDFSGLPQVNDGVTDRRRVEDALFGRLQPSLDAQRNSLDTRLRNQGLTPGSEAWDRSFREYGMTENDARLATVAQAGGEQQRLFNMSTADRQRAMAEMLAERQIPLNETAALMQGSQVQYPQFVGVPQSQVQATDTAGIAQNAYNAQMAQYNAQQNQQSGLFSGLASLGGAAMSMLPFSDRRLKENVQEIGKTDNDLPLYLFNYKGDPKPQISVMAQDVEKRDPGAVHEVGGFKAVDLERAMMASRSRKRAA